MTHITLKKIFLIICIAYTHHVISMNTTCSTHVASTEIIHPIIHYASPTTHCLYAHTTQQQNVHKQLDCKKKKLTLDERVEGLSQTINAYVAKRNKESIFYPFFNTYMLPWSNISNPQQELKTLTQEVDYQLTDVSIVRLLEQKNAYFRTCLHQLRSAKSSSFKNVSLVSLEGLAPAIKEHLDNAFISFAYKTLGIHPATFHALMDVQVPLTLNFALPADVHGLFDKETLKIFLAQTFQEKKINHAAFDPQNNRITVYDFPNEGGYNNRQLYLVASTNWYDSSYYVIKESTTPVDEIKALNAIQSLPIIDAITYPKTQPELPSFVLPVQYCAYLTGKGMSYITISPKAPGTQLSTLIKLFNKHQTPDNRKIVEAAFYRLGKQLSHFHQLSRTPSDETVLTKTVTHSDLHLFHIFYDKKQDHIFFIDNASMSSSITHKESPFIDIKKIFMMPFAYDSSFKQFSELIKGIDLHEWHEMSLARFVKGYMDAHPHHLQKIVLREMLHMFHEPISIPWVYFDGKELRLLRKQHIYPLFNRLREELYRATHGKDKA